MALISGKGTNTLTENDFDTLRTTLNGKIPDNKVVKVIQTIKAYNDMVDQGDSPYNRVTFPKLIIMIATIASLIYFIFYPLYGVYFKGETLEDKQKVLIEQRERLPNDNLSLNIQIDKVSDNQKVVKVYDYSGQRLLAQGDLNGNKAYVITSKLDNNEVKTNKWEVIRTTNFDLKEEVQEEIMDIKKNNYNIENDYKEFKSIDYGVDDIINIK